MKKAVAVGIVVFMFILGFWAAAQFALSNFDISLFTMNVSHPLFLAISAVTSVFYGVYTFLEERRKYLNSLCTVQVSIR